MVAWQEAGWEWLIKYKKWVTSNPQGAAEMETAIKWGSYILAGRLSNSALLCEVIFAASRLFEMFNDFLIRGAAAVPSAPAPEASQRLKVMLSALECVEVLAEVWAGQMWGVVGRSVVVTAIQLAKCIARFMLVFWHSAVVVPSPPIRPLDRRQAVREQQQKASNPGAQDCHVNEVVVLARSGRVMRSLAAAPPSHQRTFTPPTPTATPQDRPGKQTPSNLLAESVHTLRPLCHLAAMYLCGCYSWGPWALALAMDYTSLSLHSASTHTRQEAEELVRRRLALLFYLLRTPAYEYVTKARLEHTFSALSRHLPLLRPLLRPLQEYIPRWQGIYAYMWS